MHQELTIRRAFVREADEVYAAFLTANDAVPFAPEFDRKKYRQWVRELCRQREVWIAEIAGEAAGIMVIKIAEISFLIILPEFQRRGIGRAMVRHAVRLVRQRFGTGTNMRVSVTNGAIAALLVSEGFKHQNDDSSTEPGYCRYYSRDGGELV
jgi:ribosomal protein S18 acetylase RimI-like enzyme